MELNISKPECPETLSSGGNNKLFVNSFFQRRKKNAIAHSQVGREKAAIIAEHGTSTKI